MNASSIDIADILEAESSLELIFATNLFVGKEPTTPVDTVTIFDTSSIPPKLGFNNDIYEQPSVQIRVRSKDYQTGWNLIDSIKNTLHGRGNETWNSTFYTVIYCASGPAMLDWDENSRARFICNFQMQRRENLNVS